MRFITDEPNILLTAIGLNKIFIINYSYCWRFINNSGVEFADQDGLVKALTASPLTWLVFFGRGVLGCRVCLD